MRIGNALIAGLVGALAGLAGSLIPILRRPDPAERERRRRLAVNTGGRTGNGTIAELRDGILCYRYTIGGVEYTAFQDVSALAALLPDEPDTLIEKPVVIKYLPNNPANSIVLCEAWSGLQFQPQPT